MMETMIPPQVGMRLRTLQKEKKLKKRKKRERPKRKKKRRPNKKNKKKRPKKPTKRRKKRKKNERKREKGQCYYPFSTLVLQSSTMIFMIESLLCYHFHMLVGILHYRTWLVYSNDGHPQKCPRSS